jgi:hypothetical protein
LFKTDWTGLLDDGFLEGGNRVRTIENLLILRKP